MMKTDIFIEKFMEVEDKHDLWSYKIDGVDIWQYIRFVVYEVFLEQLNGIEYSYIAKDFRCIEKKSNEVENIDVRDPKKQFDLQKSDMLVISHPYRFKKNGVYRCNFTDDLLENVDYTYYVFEDKLHGESEKTPVITKNFKNRDIMKLKPYFYYDAKRNAHEVRIFIDKVLKILEVECGIELTNDYKKNMFYYISNILESYYYGEKHAQIILSLIQPRLCLITSAYDLANQVLIKVAKKMGIPTIELQHGLIGSTHIAYNFARKRNLESFPDYIFVHGTYDKEIPRYPIPIENVFVTGIVSLEKRVDECKIRENINEKVVLYISNPQEGKKLVNSAIMLCEKLKGKDYKIIYKLHPTEYSTWEKKYIKLIKTNIEVIDTDTHDIYYYLGKSNYVIGNLSTVMFQATVFDTRIIILENKENSICDILVERGYAILATDTEEIYNIIQQENIWTKTRDSKYFYERNALLKMKKALDKCMPINKDNIDYSIPKDVKKKVKEIQDSFEKEDIPSPIEQDLNNNRVLFKFMSEWFRKKQQGKKIGEYLSEIGYKKIAIYGMGDVGEILYDELKNSEVKVEYGIDQNAYAVFSEIPVYLPEDELQKVDVVIVTAVYFYPLIIKKIEKKIDCPIISLADIVGQI